MRLLVVEDEAAIRSALTRGLAHGGNQVVSAASLIEARSLAGSHRPEALVSDLKLPDGSGLDLACELELPFVLMSGYATYDDAVQALRLGCVDFFTKPVSIKDLRRAVDRLQARRAQAPQVVDPERIPRLARPTAVAIEVEPLTALAVAWQSADEAARLYPSLTAAAPTPELRQIVAELMQAAPERGRLVLNDARTQWLAWLEAAVDWRAQDERRQLIEDLAERCYWRPEGAIVECSHG
jgi:two-component system response regulator PilR (NtrC family)